MFKSEPKKIQTKPFADNDGYFARFQGISGTITAGQTQNIDLLITEQRAVNGLELILKGHETGDSVDLQVVYGGQVIDEFGTDWFISGDHEAQYPIVLPIKATILPTMTLRIVYKSTGAQDVSVFANYHLFQE